MCLCAQSKMVDIIIAMTVAFTMHVHVYSLFSTSRISVFAWVSLCFPSLATVYPSWEIINLWKQLKGKIGETKTLTASNKLPWSSREKKCLIQNTHWGVESLVWFNHSLSNEEGTPCVALSDNMICVMINILAASGCASRVRLRFYLCLAWTVD